METINIRVQGKGWYGQSIQMEYEIRNVKHEPEASCAGDLYVEHGQSMADAIEDWLGVNTGDFQSIDAWDAERRTVTYTFEPIASKGELEPFYDENIE